MADRKTRNPLSRRASARFALAVAGAGLAALVASGCGDDDSSPAAEPAPPEPRITLEASDQVITWQERTTLRGRLSAGDLPLGSERVEIEADVFPFDDRFRSLRRLTTDARGRFALEVRPDLNTIYRAALGDRADARSRSVRVSVTPRIDVAGRPLPAGGARFTTTLRHSPKASLDGGRAFHYFAAAPVAKRAGELRFRATTRLRGSGSGATVTGFEVPPAETRVEYRICGVFPRDGGLGPGPSNRCSRDAFDLSG